MINLRVESELSESADTADAEEEFLLETVLPVAAVKVVCHLTVLVNVGLVIGVEEVKVCTSDSNLPDAGSEVPSRECDTGGKPVAVLVHNRLGRNLGEILGIISGHLVSLGGKHLGEITVTVEKTNCHEVDVHVTGLLEVVSGQDAESSGIDAE